jgi:hypothetical protein
MEFLDEYDELELFNTLTYSTVPQQLQEPAHSVSTFTQMCSISVFMERVLCSHYSEKSLLKDPLELLQKTRMICQRLDDWRDGLPAHLKFDAENPEPAVALPHTLSLLCV